MLKKRELIRINVLSILVILLLATNSVTVKAEDLFTDVSDDDWYYEALEEAVERDIISGYPDGSFGPNESVTVEQFGKMLLESVQGLRLSASSYSEYKETFNVADSWSDRYITTLYAFRIILPGEFDDFTRPITRYEMASMAIRTLEVTEFKFYPDGIEETIRNLGIITGYPDGQFYGDKHLSRAEAVVVCRRVYDPNQRIYPVGGDTIDTGNYQDLTLFKIFFDEGVYYGYAATDGFDVYSSTDTLNWTHQAHYDWARSSTIQVLDDGVYVLDYEESTSYYSEDYIHFDKLTDIKIEPYQGDFLFGVLAKDVDRSYALSMNYKMDGISSFFWNSVLYKSDDLETFHFVDALTDNDDGTAIVGEIYEFFTFKNQLYMDMLFRYGWYESGELYTDNAVLLKNDKLTQPDASVYEWTRKTIIDNGLSYYSFVDNGSISISPDLSRSVVLDIGYDLRAPFKTENGYFAVNKLDDLYHSYDLIHWDVVVMATDTLGYIQKVTCQDDVLVLYGQKKVQAYRISLPEETQGNYDEMTDINTDKTYVYDDGRSKVVVSEKEDGPDQVLEWWDGRKSSYWYVGDNQFVVSDYQKDDADYERYHTVVLTSETAIGSHWETMYSGIACDAYVISSSEQKVQVALIPKEGDESSWVFTISKGLGLMAVEQEMRKKYGSGNKLTQTRDFRDMNLVTTYHNHQQEEKYIDLFKTGVKLLRAEGVETFSQYHTSQTNALANLLMTYEDEIEAGSEEYILYETMDDLEGTGILEAILAVDDYYLDYLLEITFEEDLLLASIYLTYEGVDGVLLFDITQSEDQLVISEIMFVGNLY